MKAYQIRAEGAAPRLDEVYPPRPGPGEVLVGIAAAGLNFADLLMVKGQYQKKPALPFTLGMEAAGTVIALGPETEGPPPGTRVVAVGGHGGLAEMGVFPAAGCTPIPDAMPFDHAAGFPIAYGTSHIGLARRARLKPGETLLVLGAAGGVGLTAVEIGKLMGARVIACARGADKLAICKAAGADHLIDSDSQDIREAVKALGGADVVYDPVGGDQFTAAMRATKPEGRILVVGFASGEVPQIPANHLLVKNIDVIGYWWGGYTGFNPAAIRESMGQLLAWYEAGQLSPHVSHRLPLERAGEAYDLLRSRASTGKVVVTIGAQPE
ncbi:NADPH:quinone oxidoreductase family protein [Sinisalibacter aestuarii]|uniref:NADPH:quinone oxidoreductase n=1 Tax=Sinisalibacter aestuarii TaxID=2949426 RepID=A0ABQ5LSI3_9RHOB|nr:NADPH:quinone oxidoreductase family protein [Sinisalibacter aestuarii]GKY87276.1 NADPH:quinone oxidoreductase [Sinisalibacter aestuarii]